jgi:hypothetical protein
MAAHISELAHVIKDKVLFRNLRFSSGKFAHLEVSWKLSSSPIYKSSHQQLMVIFQSGTSLALTSPRCVNDSGLAQVITLPFVVLL